MEEKVIKKKELVLKDQRNDTYATDESAFRIEKAVNTIEYVVGRLLTEEEVQKALDDEHMTVHIG